jgi:hypothetical protein
VETVEIAGPGNVAATPSGNLPIDLVASGREPFTGNRKVRQLPAQSASSPANAIPKGQIPIRLDYVGRGPLLAL